MRWIAVVALVAVSLAGCSEETTAPLDAKTEPARGADGTNSTVPGLTAALGLDAPDDAVAPLEVRLTVDAPGAADPGNVSWSITSAHNGTETLLGSGEGVPAELAHTFGAGEHLLRLEVVEAGESAVETLTLVVDAAGAGDAVTEVADRASFHRLQGSFAMGTADPTFGPVPSPGTGPAAVLEFEVPQNASAVHLWIDWNDGTTGNTPLLTDLDVDLFDAAGTAVAHVGTTFFEYAYEEGAYAAGTWRVELWPYAVPVDTDFVVEVVAWNVVPQQTVFTGTGGGFALGTPADTAPDEHVLDLPAGTQTVAARLGWTMVDGAGCEEKDSYTNDYDFDAALDGTLLFGRGSLGACEFGAADAAEEDLGGAWSFQVHKFLTAPSDYALTVYHA